MAASAEDVLKDLRANKFAPVYFLQGDEPYYIDAISEYIEKKCLQEHERSFNQTVVYGKDTNVSTVMQYAKKFPMMAERQVVIVKEAQDLPDLAKEAGEKLLTSYIQNPLPSTVLVFCHKYKTLDGRKALGKLFDKHAVLVTTKKLYDNQLPDWIQKFFQEKGIKITPRAAGMVADYIGNDLSRIANESEKLLINLKDKREVDESHIEKFVGISKEYNVFELQKALVARDPLKAHRIVDYFEANPKNNPLIPTLASLFGFFTKILLVHGSDDKSDTNLAKVLQVHPFFVKDYTQAARSYPLPKAMSAIHHIHLADLQSKGIQVGAVSEGQILKELVYKIMH
ncbi:MAG: DNA polymerase III subunit delta [Cytophagaceae bacterium]|jgi:DNA polymerase-3 subunit delta|nr:DNA polymerase III subunit delta [Cytophagaceae bacterium]